MWKSVLIYLLLTGLHGLVTATSDEQRVVLYTRKRLESFLNISNISCQRHKFVSKSLDFLNVLEKRNIFSDTCNPYIQRFPCMQCVINVLAESTYSITTFCICKTASDHVIVLPKIIKYQLEIIFEKLNKIEQDLLLLMQLVEDVIIENDSFCNQDYHDLVYIAKLAESIQYLVDNLNPDVETVVDAVNVKCLFEIRFFNTASLITGAASLGKNIQYNNHIKIYNYKDTIVTIYGKSTLVKIFTGCYLIYKQ